MDLKLERIWHRKGTGTPPDDFADHFYIHEIVFQCSVAENVFANMQHTFKVAPRDGALLALAHIILVAAGNVGKILSPPKGENKKVRAARLRTALECDGVAFETIANARNYLEHFDERIERFVYSDEVGVTLHRLVTDSPVEMIRVGEEDLPARCLQHLNTNTLELTLMGESINLSEVLAQTKQIREKAEAYLAIRIDSRSKR